MSAKPNLKDVNGLELDRRVWAYDEERRIAEIALKGRLEGEWEWVEPTQAYMNSNQLIYEEPYVDNVYAIPMINSSEEFAGSSIEVLFSKELDGWIFYLIRDITDHYIGWVSQLYVRYTQPVGVKANVQSLRCYLYTEPSVKRLNKIKLSYGSIISKVEAEDTWVRTDVNSNWIHKSALEPSNLTPLEWVKGFLGTPYLWGGRSAWGIDCSGLSQMYFRYQSIYIPRDADQQEAAFIRVDEPRAGDLAFFDGHVGILLEQSERGNWRMIHANSRHMSVTIDTLGEGEYGQYLSSIFHGYGRWQGEVGVYWKPK